VSLAPYAVDDGVVSAAMTKMLTTDTSDTLGAQNDDIMWWALAFLRAYEAHPAFTPCIWQRRGRCLRASSRRRTKPYAAAA